MFPLAAKPVHTNLRNVNKRSCDSLNYAENVSVNGLLHEFLIFLHSKSGVTHRITS